MSPTSRYLPIETQLSQEQYDDLLLVIKDKEDILKKPRQLTFDEQLWYTDQLLYLRQMRKFNQEHNPDITT